MRSQKGGERELFGVTEGEREGVSRCEWVGVSEWVTEKREGEKEGVSVRSGGCERREAREGEKEGVLAHVRDGKTREAAPSEL